MARRDRGRKERIGRLTVRPFIRSGEATEQWQLDIPAELSPLGKRQRRLFPSKKEAVAEAKRLDRLDCIREVNRGRRPPPCGLSLHDILPEWLEREEARVRTGKRAPSTLVTNLHRLKPVLAFFDQDDLTAIQEARLTAYQEHRFGLGMKPSTINTEVSTLLKLLRWSVKEGYLFNVPDVEAMRVHLEDHDMPTPEEVRAIIEALPEHLRPLILLFAETGCRKGEALNLTWEQVDEVQGTISIRRRAGEWSAKTQSSYRTLFLSDELVEQLRQIEKVGRYVFYSRKKPAQPVTDFRKSLAAAVKKARVTRRGRLMRITPQVLRQAYVTWQQERGTPESIVQALVGHARGSSVTRRHYTHHGEKALRDAKFELREPSSKRTG